MGIAVAPGNHPLAAPGRGSRALSDETVAACPPRTVRRRPWRVVEVLTSRGCRSRFIGDFGSGHRFVPGSLCRCPGGPS